MPALSVIMTVYNGEKFVAETVEAVLAQTFSDFEYVIVDNGCTDGTMDIVARYNDPRIRIVKAPHHGSFGDGIRLAYHNARGAFIAVQDGDDISLPDRFERQVAALRSDSGVALVSGGYERIDASGQSLGIVQPPAEMAKLVDAYQTTNPLAHSTFMVRRSAADAVGGYPPQYNYGPDFALAVRLLKAGQGIAVLEGSILKLREHPGQVTRDPATEIIQAHDALYLYLEAGSLDGISSQARRAGKRNLTKQRIRYGLALMGAGKLREGVGLVASALPRQPLYGLAYLGVRMFRAL